MKKKILIGSVLWSSLAFAAPSLYEVSALGGIVFPDSDTQLENETILGAALQYNGFGYFFAPELQVLQSLETDFKTYPGDPANTSSTSNGSTFINRINLYAVHDIDLHNAWTPFFKVGLGYESYFDYNYFENENGLTGNAAAGLKYAITKSISVRVEAMAMHKFYKRQDLSYDNSFGLLGGLTYRFGTVPTETAPASTAAQSEPTPAPVAATSAAAPEAAPVTVSADAAAATAAAAAAVAADSDGDGVADSSDKCPHSTAGYAVDADGCEVAPTFSFSFQFDSADVPVAAQKHYKQYGAYVKRNDLNLKVIGYADDTGTAAYNQELSLRRAETVAGIIETAGVPADKIHVEGRGETNPLMSNKTKAGRAANRRVELIPYR